MFMSVVTAERLQRQDAVVACVWRSEAERGVDFPLGEGAVGTGACDIGFMVTINRIEGDGVLGCAPVGVPPSGWALRLDEVAFPVGAIAHRHTHSGSGWRYLVSGALRLEAEHHTTLMGVGDSWFEPADTPVRAVAMHDQGVTRFVRCMVIPQADVGRSTFQLCDARDAELPRLQMTHRHFDHPIQVDAG